MPNTSFAGLISEGEHLLVTTEVRFPGESGQRFRREGDH
jgi:hypothetical protein